MTCSECSAELSETASRCRACGTARGATKTEKPAPALAPAPGPDPAGPARAGGSSTSSVLSTIGTVLVVVVVMGLKAVVRYERRHRNDSSQRDGR